MCITLLQLTCTRVIRAHGPRREGRGACVVLISSVVLHDYMITATMEACDPRTWAPHGPPRRLGARRRLHDGERRAGCPAVRMVFDGRRVRMVFGGRRTACAPFVYVASCGLVVAAGGKRTRGEREREDSFYALGHALIALTRLLALILGSSNASANSSPYFSSCRSSTLSAPFF